MSSILNVNPTCPEGCESTLPDTSFNLCSPEVSFGEITDIFIGNADADPFTDWESLAQWTAALARDHAAANAIRQFMVSADLPAAVADEVVISKGRKVYSPATHTINVDVDDLSIENYEFARTTSCNLQMRIWFMTPEHQYGGPEGILAMVNLRPVIERGIKSLNKLSGTITWDAKFSAERADSVYAT